MSAIRSSSASSSTSGRPAKRATTSTVMSSAVGPEPAARDHHVHVLVGHEAELRLHVLRAVPGDRDVGELDAELEQPVGEPGAVAVADAAGQHLRARYDDPGTGAHRRLRARALSERERLVELGVNSNPTGSGPGSIGTFFPFTRTSTGRLAEVEAQPAPAEGLGGVERALEGHLGPLPAVHAHVGRGAGGHADHHAPRWRGRRLALGRRALGAPASSPWSWRRRGPPTGPRRCSGPGPPGPRRSRPRAASR